MSAPAPGGANERRGAALAGAARPPAFRLEVPRQVPVDRFIVDLACVDARLIVEVDGATHSTDREIAADAERTRVLEACGFHILRVTNAEVYDNLGGVLETILAELERRVHL